MSEAAPVVADAPAIPPESTQPGDQAAPETPPVAATTPPKDAPPAAPPPKRTVKAKVYGEERELSAEYVEGMAKELGIPPEFILRNLQTSAAAQKRMQEAAEVEKQAKALRDRLKTDPWEVLKSEGLDPDQAAIARVQRLMEQEAMTPEQRAYADAQRRIQELEAKTKAAEEQQQSVQQKAETDKVIATLNQAIPAAAEAAGLPKSPAVGRMMVEFMLSQARAGVDVDPHEAAVYAKENVQSWTGEVLKSMDGPQLEAFLGPETMKKILAHSVAKVRGGNAPAPAPANPTGQPPARTPTFLTTDEWRKRYG